MPVALHTHASPYPDLAAMLRMRAGPAGGRTAVAFLRHDLEVEERLTFTQLLHQSLRVAQHLMQHTRQGDRVLLALAPGLDFVRAFWGCVLSGRIAVPVPDSDALRQRHAAARLQTIITDADASLVLSHRARCAQAEQAAHAWHAIEDATLSDPAKPADLPRLDPQGVVYLQYTSGSTSAPKGVVLTHAQVLAQCVQARRAMGMGRDSRTLCWLPHYHDYGLVSGLLWPMAAGGTSYLMSPLTFLRDPLRWLQAVARFRITHTGAPNFAFAACAKAIESGARLHGRLDSLQWLTCGAEPIHAPTIERFLRLTVPHGLRPSAFRAGYGMAETVLSITVPVRAGGLRVLRCDPRSLTDGHAVHVNSQGSEHARILVACGSPAPTMTVRVVDPESREPLPAGQVGELWVRGPFVGSGYWRRPQESSATFEAHTSAAEGPFLRTGDLGFIDRGQIYITGRLKDLIIVRGRNHHPQDIEWTVQHSAPAVRSGRGCAFAVDGPDGEALVIVQELERRHGVQDFGLLCNSIREAVSAEHGIVPSVIVLVRAGAVPVTSSGKVQRAACKQLYLSGLLVAVHQESRESPDLHTVGAEIELTPQPLTKDLRPSGMPPSAAACKDYLRALVAQLTDRPSDEIDDRLSLFGCGLDSLAVFQMLRSVENWLGRPLDPARFLTARSVEALAADLAEQARFAHPSTVAACETTGPPPETAILSPAQQGMWVLDRLRPPGTYHLAVSLLVSGTLDTAALERCLERIVDRHRVLRTSIAQHGEALEVRVGAPGRVSVEVIEVPQARLEDAALVARMQADACEPFPFDGTPLLRARLYRDAAERSVLLLVTHHLVFDGWSFDLLLAELAEFSEQERTGVRFDRPEATGYDEYALEHHRLLDGPEGERLLEYWRGKLAAFEPLELLPDRPPPAHPGCRAEHHRLRLSAPLLERVRQLSLRLQTTPYVVMLAAFKAVLARYTGQDDIAVGSPSACRLHARHEKTVGYFSNTLVLRTTLDGDPSFEALVGRVNETTVEAHAHQAYPSDRLVAALGLPRVPGRNPLYPVVFAWRQRGVSEVLRLPGACAQVRPFTLGIARTDLWVECTQTHSGVELEYEYSADLFDAETIHNLARHHITLLKAALAAPETPLSRLPLLSKPELERLLHTWNDTHRHYPLELAAHELFDQVAAEAPDAPAVAFGQSQLSYDALRRRADQLAALLRGHGVAPGDLVAIAMDRSLELPIAMLGVLKAAAAFLPIDPDYPGHRISFMLADSKVKCVLTQSHLRGAFRQACGDAQVLCVDEIPLVEAVSLRVRTSLPAQSLAYAIYTSGSTGIPKACLLTHRGLTNHLLWLRETLRLGPGDRILQKTSISFDASVWEFLAPLVSGATVVLAEPDSHRDPAALIRQIRTHRVTILQMVPSALRALVEQGGLEHCLTLKHLVCGGEALDWDLVHRCRALLPDVKIGNFYGPSEASDDATHWEVGEDGPRAGVVPLGRPIANARCLILDRHAQPVPPRVAGELHIGGAGLGRGYLGRPDLTAERFIEDPYRPGERLYRTGDIARYRHDGVIEFLGRADFQVKVRGHRVELGEVEAALRSIEGIEDAAVAASCDTTATKLVAYVVGPRVRDAEVLARLRDVLPEYMCPSAVVSVPRLPRLPNGKLDRKALPSPAPAHAELEHVPPRSPTEQLLWEVWRDVLRHGGFGVHDDFFSLGGHSLLATQVLARLRKVCQADLPLRAIFSARTIAELAPAVEAARHATHELLPDDLHHSPPLDRAQPLPVSYSQRRMWLVQQFDPDSTAYNIPYAVELKGPLDLDSLLRSAQALVERHEAFRTSFVLQGDEPMQKISPAAELPLVIEDFSSAAAGEDRKAKALRWLEAHAAVPFDLSTPPLHRLFLAKLDDQHHLMMWLVHHAIGDEWSGTILLKEFAALYGAAAETPPALPAIEVAYADYAAWQRATYAPAALARQLAYWRSQLHGMTPLDLPTDRPRLAWRSSAGRQVSVTLPVDLLAAVRETSIAQGVTPFMVLLAGFNVLLSRVCGQQDIAVGTPIANRTHFAAEHLVGTLVNTLVMRCSLEGDPTFAELVERVRHTALDAYDHQDVPFDFLVERLQAEGSARKDLGISVLFNVLNAPLEEVRLTGGLRLAPLEVDRGSAQFDLSMHVDTEFAHRVTIEYAADLFSPETAGRWLESYLLLLQQALADPRRRVSSISLMTPSDVACLGQWNATMQQVPSELCVHDLLATQARARPHARAVTAAQQRLSYAELDEKSNRLAHELRAHGAARGSLVGLCLPRGLDMLVAQLAILKCGAAYVPLDPAFPAERLAYMADDAQLALLVTSSPLAGLLPWPRERSVLLDIDTPRIERHPSTALPRDERSARPEDPAYVIYTSGSTGRPKGVVVPHRAVVNFLLSMAREPGLAPSDRLLAVTTLSFDIAVLELLLPLAVGAQIVMASRDEAMDGQALHALLLSSQATVMQATPSTWRMLLEAGWQGSASFKALIGGEPLPADLAEQLLARTGELWNMYGPTETTVWSTCARVSSLHSGISIGRPIANTQVHILDERGQPCPIGVPGEICIGGLGLASGYWRRPELTAERFIDDPQRPGHRLYRTGDRGRWRHDGWLEHQGRLDSQVKLRGYRIELGEIEAQLASHPGVARCVVALREDHPGDARLLAYVVPDGPAPQPAALREHLRRTLPEYMLPQHFVMLEAIPLLPNGKIDRKALPAPPSAARSTTAASLAPPTTAAEIAIAEVWQRLLGIEHVSCSDNFFDLGGHSLLAMRAASDIEARLGVRLPVRRLIFESLSQIAAACSPAPPPSPPSYRRPWLARVLHAMSGRVSGPEPS